jgi:hypothetical protein
MGNIELFKRELTKSLKTHFVRKVMPRALQFIKNEINILLDSNINKLKNDNTVKPQRNHRKSKDTNPSKGIR